MVFHVEHLSWTLQISGRIHGVNSEIVNIIWELLWNGCCFIILSWGLVDNIRIWMNAIKTARMQWFYPIIHESGRLSYAYLEKRCFVLSGCCLYMAFFLLLHFNPCFSIHIRNFWNGKHAAGNMPSGQAVWMGNPILNRTRKTTAIYCGPLILVCFFETYLIHKFRTAANRGQVTTDIDS